MAENKNPEGPAEQPGSGTTPGNRSAAFFLICLLISTVLWFLNALNKNYSAVISHPVDYNNIPVNRFIANHPPSRLNVKVSGQGFVLLKYRMTASFSPLELDIARLITENPPSSAGVFVLSADRIKNITSSQISKELQLVEVTPPLITLDFDTLSVKKLPIGSNLALQFKPQFELVGDVVFRPARVTVTGPGQVIAELDTIYTISQSFKNLESSFSQEVQLVVPRQTVVEPGKVTFSATIDEFTEKTLRIPVWVDNQPEEVRVLLFPHEVEIRFLTGLKTFALIKPEDFQAFVSWEEIGAQAPVLKIRIRKQPVSVKALKISPEHVEYLIERK